MKTILAPIDFSDATDPVLAAAIEMARVFSADVVLAHATEPPVIVDEYSPVLEEMLVAEEEAVAEKLEHLRRRFSDLGIKADTRQLYGAAPREVAEEARRLRPDLIVIGSHGHGALYDLLVGSVTAHILRHAACPVLVVPVGSKPGKTPDAAAAAKTLAAP